MNGTVRYCQADMPRARMSPLKVVVPVPEYRVFPVTVRLLVVSVPVAVMLAADTLPENRPLPWTPRAKLEDGEVVPTPTLPAVVAKYADPDDVRAVVEA